VDADSRSRRAELIDAIRLAVVPFGVAILFGLLLLPRRGAPDDVPVPIPDAAGLARAIAVDQDRAARARSEPLPAPVRALGSAIRAYHSLEASQNRADLARIRGARDAVDAALIEALAGGDEGLLGLRAVQLEAFLGELRRFESSGVETEELAALAGAFVPSMKAAGWCDGHTLVPREPALRALFKEMWDAFLGLQGRPAFDPSLDEERALYALYLSAPHPSPTMRAAIESARLGAHDPGACEGVREAERGATEEWRLERIRRLATIDPTYPAAYARGVASYRRADYRGAEAAFRTWLTAHPDGALSLRARSFLRAAEAQMAE
jgi:hypothetical protein